MITPIGPSNNNGEYLTPGVVGILHHGNTVIGKDWSLPESVTVLKPRCTVIIIPESSPVHAVIGKFL